MGVVFGQIRCHASLIGNLGTLEKHRLLPRVPSSEAGVSLGNTTGRLLAPPGHDMFLGHFPEGTNCPGQDHTSCFRSGLPGWTTLPCL